MGTTTPYCEGEGGGERERGRRGEREERLNEWLFKLCYLDYWLAGVSKDHRDFYLSCLLYRKREREIHECVKYLGHLMESEGERGGEGKGREGEE